MDENEKEARKLIKIELGKMLNERKNDTDCVSKTLKNILDILKNSRIGKDKN